MHAQAVRTAPLDESLFARAEGEHEQLIDILASLWEDRQRIFSVNLPNQGVVPGLPAEAIVELPAAATGRGFLPSHAPARPPALIGTDCLAGRGPCPDRRSSADRQLYVVV